MMEKSKKPTILGLRTCLYKVKELDAAKVWYAKAFKQEPYFDEPFYVGFNIGGFELGLQEEEKPNNHVAENTITYWGVSDIEKEFKHFSDLGAIIHEEPTNVGGELMVASLIDPWKNIIGLIYNPHFSIPK